MFTDARSKRIVFIAHCLLNQNAISDGTADFPGANRPLIQMLLDSGVGIVQLPCPELTCLGLDRGDACGAERPVLVENTRIRGEMQKPPACEGLAALVDGVLYQMQQYRKHGFQLVCLVGSNRSPCCGVDTTSDQGRELAGQGVFVAALTAALEERHIPLPVIGVKAGDDLARLRALL